MKFSAKYILPIIVVALAVMAMIFLIKSRPTAKKGKREVASALVEAIEIRRGNAPVFIEASGTVIPAQSIVLQPEVAGRIVQQSEHLAPGAMIAQGEVIARIDTRDYQFAVQRQKAEVARAELELKLEESRTSIAGQEWKIMNAKPATDKAGEALALRQPQLAAARAFLSAAQSGLDQALLNLERTTIRAPFNALVLEEFVDVGQSVSPQSAIAKLAGSDRFWVRVSVPTEMLSRIAIPGKDETEGAKAVVTQRLSAKRSIKRVGRVIRRLGDLDPVGRMARILVAVDHPLRFEQNHNPEEIPLMLGAYVQVKIEGPILKDVAILPRRALRGDDRVWLMNRQDQLEFKTISVIWKSSDEVYVRTRFQPGARIIVSALTAPIEGMPVWLEDSNPRTDDISEPKP